jgi:hypothetical protein
VVSATDPYSRPSQFSRPEPLLFHSSTSSVILTRLSGPCSIPTVLRRSRDSDWQHNGRPRGPRSSPSKEGFSTLRVVQSDSGAHSASQPIRIEASPGIKQLGRETHYSPISTEVKNRRIYALTPQYVFKA